MPGMREGRFGVLVNISSGVGLEGRKSMGAYAPAKARLMISEDLVLCFVSTFLNQAIDWGT